LRKVLIVVLVLTGLFCNAQQDTLTLNYFHRSPFAYTENGNPRGIEIDIMNEFILWLKARKKLDIAFRYREFNDYGAFYAATKSGGKNCVGLGSTAVTADKAREMDFTAPYLRNVAFCVTNGHAPDVKTKSPDEIMRSLGSMNALTIPNTNLNRYVNDIKKKYIQDLPIVFHQDEVKILDEISRNVLSFGYVDAIGFWFYVKNNPHKFLKMQKILSQSTDEMAFMMPKASRYKALFDEFFAGPAGFRTLPGYRAILERHLGSYMAQNVAVN
jgi:putative glutamine transport system substrate-binding protein